MQIRVDKDNLRIIKLSQLESGEVDVTEVNFIFTPEYKDLIKTAVFTLGDKSYKVILQNDKCFVPTEVLVAGNKIKIGVYAFKQDSEELILRYSPVPVTAEILEGSFVEEAENTSHPTPTEIEQLLELILTNKNSILELSERVDTLEQDKDKCISDIDSIKDDIFDIKSDIQDLEDDVTSIRSDINNINENIDDIDGQIFDINADISNINTSITNIERVDERQNRRLNAIDNILRQLPKTEYQMGTNINLGKTIQAVVQYEDDKVLYGDTSQDTTKGYNLWGGFNDFTNSNYVTKSNGTITYNNISSGATSATTALAVNNNLLKTIPAGTYIVSTTGLIENLQLNVVQRTNGTSGSVIKTLSTLATSGTITLEAESEIFIRLQAQANITGSGIVYIQLETGTTAHEWEKYTGGIASPNPSFPENINVVTGTLEVAVKNGNNETQATYTIHLGNLELAKIGDYQDYIYFDVDEGKWYKKKAINKDLISSIFRVYSNGMCGVKISNESNVNANYYSTHFQYGGGASNSTTAYNYGNNKMSINNDNIGVDYGKLVYLRSDNITTETEWTNFINNNNLYIYSVASTSTDEEITDTTLIQDLDNILAMMSVEGTTIIEVSGNLPANIKVRAFAQLQAAT